MSSKRIEDFKRSYIESKPSISIKRALAFTASHKQTEGESVIIRRAKAFKAVCESIPVTIFDNELIVGAIGEFRKSGIICPEYSWKWVDSEMDTFASRNQDPYCVDDIAKRTLRNEIFPYWQGKSLEETFLSRINPETANILIDTGIIDSDSKWRNAVGEVTADYQDVIFKKGFGGLRAEALAQLEQLEPVTPEALEKIDFYQAAVLVAEGITALARRYSEQAIELARQEADVTRKAELLDIAGICQRVPEQPPKTFYEAVQMVWFTQLGSILSENSLALNLGRFDQYMHPYFAKDIETGVLTTEKAQELIEALWIKLSEWVWAISSNTAKFFAGYNSFQKYGDVIRFIENFLRGGGNILGYRQDGALNRPHDAFISRQAAFIEGANEKRDVQRLEVIQRAGESTPDLRENYAGISSGAHQRTLGDSVRHFSDIVFW